VIDLNIPMGETPKWFEGAKLNFAENLLKYRDERVAFIVTDEDMKEETITFAQMFEETRLYAAAFRKFGLKKGDIVVCK
ncbi:acetoacetyl-CoA synthetase, partial [Nephila pilipes]